MHGVTSSPCCAIALVERQGEGQRTRVATETCERRYDFNTLSWASQLHRMCQRCDAEPGDHRFFLAGDIFVGDLRALLFLAVVFA